MKKFFAFSIIASFLFSTLKIEAQDIKKLTFDEVIKLAEEQSPNALMAKHRFRASYWQFRSYQAQYLPSLTLSGTTPAFSNGLEKVYDYSTNTYSYQRTNTISNMGTLSLAQNIGPTGTAVSYTHL